MDWYPLWNSLRIAAISCVIVFFLGIFAAYKIAALPKLAKGVLDVLLTLPLVLPPTVCGWILLLLFGLTHPLGIYLKQIGIQFVMTWYGGVIASAVVAFPLMYRTARGALMKTWLGVPGLWGCRNGLSFGESACLLVSKASLPALSWLLLVLWVSTVRRVCLSAIYRIIRLRFLLPCISYGEPMTSTVLLYGLSLI